MSLRRALLLLVAVVLALGLVPAGLLLERRLAGALLDRARADLGSAPMVLKDRYASEKTVRMMHARDFSVAPGLVEAFETGDMTAAERLVETEAAGVQEVPVLVDPGGALRLGPEPIPDALVAATRRGEMPVSVVPAADGLHLLALAPVKSGAEWMGAVGGSTPFAEDEAATLSGLTGADVVILAPDGRVVASTVDAAVSAALAATDVVEEVVEVAASDRTFLATASVLDEARVLFLKDVASELAVLPDLRRTGAIAAGVGLALALLVGGLFAGRVARPVSELADAVEGFGAGEDALPLKESSVLEVRRLGRTFSDMRDALARRMAELEEANQALEDRQHRLATLQAELVQRERLATSGRLLAQLAHEIRNPVASVRNCLEVVRRRGDLEGEAAEFADMAVDELLRMHELAERMLDLHRPRPGGGCDPAQVARDTVHLVRAGAASGEGNVSFTGASGPWVSIPSDDLKQVLLNLVLNAIEASPEGAPVEIVQRLEDGRVVLEVLDRGPGIPKEIRDRVFDPFFTTKDQVHGVGLGLYTAEGLVRAAGGSLTAENREDGPGARFTLSLPRVSEAEEAVS